MKIFKNYFFYFLLFVFCFSISGFAQYRQWEKAIGGVNFDEGISLIQTSDGGYAIAGTTETFGQGGYDVYIMKFDSAGIMQWTKTIGGTGTDIGYSIVQTKDKGYGIAGYTTSFGQGYGNAYIIKLDSSGNLIWARTVGVEYAYTYAYSIVNSNDGGFVVGGTMNNINNSQGAYCFKLDSLGNVKWTKVFNVIEANPNLNSVFYSAINTADRGYAFAGYANGWGYGYSNYCYVVKTDSNGNVNWASNVGGTVENYAYSVKQSGDGGYIVAGYTTSYGSGGNDVYVVKLNASGNIKWTRTIGGTGSDIGWSVVESDDGGYLVAGYTNSYGAGGYDVYLVKLDSVGGLQWTKTIGGTGNDYAYSIIKTRDGGYAIAGNTSSYGNGNADVFFLKLDLLGNTCTVSGSGGIVNSGGTLSSGYNTISAGSIDSGGIASIGGAEVLICSADTCSIPLSLQVTNLKCCGANNGTVKVSVLGGVSPYTYSWSPPEGNADSANGLSAGSYIVTVHDSLGCIGFGLITITQPPCLKDSILGSPSLGCNCHGTIEVFAYGGTPPYTYLWSTGGTYDTVHNLKAGEYYVTICDSNGCCISDSFGVANGDPVSFSQTNVTCYGYCNGSATITTWGWNGYLWSPGGETIASVSGLCAGTYSVTVTNLDTACSATYVFVINQPPLLTATASVVSEVSCYGGSNGSATVVAGGGTPGYSYVWSPSGGNGATANGLTAGTYNVQVTDANGCTADASVTITQPTATFTVSISDVSSACSLNPTLEAICTGGTPPYSYSWEYGSHSSSESITFWMCPEAYGDYVNVTDSKGCTAYYYYIFPYTPPLWYSVTQSNVTCSGGNNGSITMEVCGGSPTYQYTWYPSGSAYSSNPTYTASNLSAGIYSVFVTDNSGCSTQTGTITITQSPAISVTTSLTVANCSTSATAHVSGGTSPYTYSWSPSGGSNATASNLSTGTYTVNVTDHNGCTGSASVVITEPAALSAQIWINSTCINDPTLTAMVTGGKPPYTYLWSDAETSSSIMILSFASCPSYYTFSVNVTDNNGCQTSYSKNINSNLQWSYIPYTLTNVTCYGENNGTITMNICGGYSPYEYTWNASNASNEYSTTYTATNLSAGTYTISVSDIGCNTGTEVITITQPPALLVSATVTSNVTCNIGNNGSASSTVSGGTSPYTYLWSGGNGTNTTASGLTAGTYTLSITDNHGCTNSATVTITEPSISITTTTIPYTCAGPGSATAFPLNGFSPYTFSWSGGGGTNGTATGLSVGTYTVYVADSNGCTGSAIAVITQPTPLNVSANTINNVSCNGGNNGNAASSVFGGTSPYTYLWSDVNSQTTANASGLSMGIYTVNVIDRYGCTGSAIVSITQPNQLNVLTNNIISVSCYGGNNGSMSSTVSGGTLPYSYSWSNSQTITSISGLSIGTYTLNVTDRNGCTGSATAIITQPTAISIHADSINDNGGCSGSAWALVNGGVTPYTYLWTGGGTTDTITNQCYGNYCCIVTDANGCVDSVCVTINLSTGTSILISNTGSITVYPNPGNGIFTIASSITNSKSLLEIYNVLGQRIYSTNLNLTPASEFEINISDKAAGVYFYRVLKETGELVGSGKIIVEK